MIIRDGLNYFTFKFQQSDFKKYPFAVRKKFIEAVKKNINTTDRHYIAKTKEWQIKIIRKRQFLELINKYLDTKQKSLF